MELGNGKAPGWATFGILVMRAESPYLWGPVQREQERFVVAFQENKVAFSKLGTERKQRVQDSAAGRLLAAFVPKRTPAGLIIGEEVRNTYLRMTKGQDIPAIDLENRLFDCRLRDVKSNAGPNDLIDIRDLVAAVYSVDVLLVDKKFRHYLGILNREDPLPTEVFSMSNLPELIESLKQVL